jgi:hypothetical protein
MPDNEHTWFRRHLPDHLLDLLVDRDRERFEAHARSCAPCARLLASALGTRADWWDGAGHPPVEVLLHWDVASRGERTHDAVRAHVTTCESCRTDLEDLHGKAVASELALAPVPPRGEREARPHRSAPARVLAVAAGLLAVAAAVYVLDRPAGRETPRSHRATGLPPAASTATPGPAGPTAAPPAAAPSRPVVSAEPVEIPATRRGDAAGATRIDVAPGVTRVPLTLPALDVPEGATLSLELRRPDGELAWRQELPAGRALRRGGVVLPAADLATGIHVLRVSWTDSGLGISAREFSLDVRTSR